jgi:adenylate cyclase
MWSAPLIESIRIGTSNGNLISISDLAQSGEADNPDTAKYRIEITERSGPTPIETLEYLDIYGNVIEKKQIPHVRSDPRNESWYRIVATWPHLRWSSDYISFQNQVVSNISLPIEDENYTVYAVASLNISLSELSNIVAYQKVGESGKVYILNERGERIVPFSTSANVHSALLSDAYNQYQETKEKNFRLENEDVTYLINCSLLPLDYETTWLIITIVPFNDFFASLVETEHQTILISVAIFVAFSLFSGFVSRYISSPIVKIAEQSAHLQRLDFEKNTPIYSHISEIITLVSSFNAMHNALSSFARYVPKEVVRMLIGQQKEIELGGQRGELTILFTDIENFTTTAEILPIETLLSALSEYFEAYSKMIVDSEGTIDKYIGDSIMAFWNAPIPVADACSKACLAALRCLKFPKEQKRENPFLTGTTRFGIHDGDVIYGNIGTSERMCYTAIGNAVNTASRLQSLNKQYQTRILISETVHERIGSNFVTRPLDFVHMKGKTRGMTVYELVGLKKGAPELVASPGEITLCEDFTKGYEHFHEGKMEEALQCFTSLSQQFPSDYSTKVYLEKAKAVYEKKSGNPTVP